MYSNIINKYYYLCNMRLSNYNNNCSLVIDKIARTNNRISFNISVVLYNKRTDTNIFFSSSSYIDINNWQQRYGTLLSQNKLNLENLSFYANYDKTYHLDIDKENYIQNIFELSNNYCHLKFQIDSESFFNKEFLSEITEKIRTHSILQDIVPTSHMKKGYIHMIIKKVNTSIESNRCFFQLEICSDYFHIMRHFDDDIKFLKHISDDIQRFNEGKLQKIEIQNENLHIESKWINGKKRVEGTISDFTWPKPNEIIFNGTCEINFID